MLQRRLGPRGPMVSEIGVGAWQLGGPLLLDGRTDGHPDLGTDEVVRLIRRCQDDLGINFIDTAEQYGAGESERRVGLALEGRRDRWIVATKFGAQVGPNGERINDVSARRIPISLEGSLRRLRTDHIDVYLYHTPPDPKEAEAVAAFLQEAKRAGKVGLVGISTNDVAQCRYLHGLGCLDVVQFATSIMNPCTEMKAFIEANGLGSIVRGAFYGGRLNGRYFDKPPALRPDDIRSNWFKPDTCAAEFGKFRVFSEFVKPGRSMVQVALRYLLDEATTHTIILGAKSFDDYAAAALAPATPALTAAERTRIQELARTLA